MIIGREFAWAHLPKTGGDATSALFQLFPETIEFAHGRETNDKHDGFRDHIEKVRGKTLVMNIRRLPSWILSLAQHQAKYGLEHTRPELETPEGMSQTTVADKFLTSFLDHGRFAVGEWLRTEMLVEDFLCLISKFTELTPMRELRVRNTGGVNAMQYDHRLRNWFTTDQIASMYRSNPNWCFIERAVYGDTLAQPKETLRRVLAYRQSGRVELTEVTNLERETNGSERVGFHLECPFRGEVRDAFNVHLRGRLSPADYAALDVIHRGVSLRKVPLNTRTEWEGAAGSDPGKGVKFDMLIGTIGMPSEYKILLRGKLLSGRHRDLALIEGCQLRLSAEYQNVLSPIMVTTRGRSGSSWLMRLLATHDSIVADPPHPYETHEAGYWLHAIKVLSEPADHEASSPRNTFGAERKWIGHNPFYTTGAVERDEIHDWYGRALPETLASFAMHNIDEFYRRVATRTGKRHPIYFAEKFQADHLPWIAWNIYPEAREIILVRDFRDMVSSIFAFNKKRGKQGFGRDEVVSDLDYVRLMRGNILSFLQTWRLREKRAFLLRYEDMILEPHKTLEQLMEYLGIEANVGKMIERARESTPEVRGHKTISDPTLSIGRWRRDLEPELQRACEECFHDALVAFGYE